ncbi:MAG TPA: hypothetical protein VMR18_01550 [Candidatus Saccharimonadales bacterium]|nr:hypothetical protein [Candidatus Saccharimonadales bacterium]
MSRVLDQKHNLSDSHVMLEALAEELRMPLLHIIRGSELALLKADYTQNSLESVRQNASTALNLVESYLLGLQIADKQSGLDLQPTSINSVLYDVMHSLDGLAKQYDIDLQLDVEHNRKLVMANPAGLQAAFLSLTYSFIQANNLTTNDKSKIVRLVAHRKSDRIAAGVYGEGKSISAKQLRAACIWYGKFKQPLNNLSSSSAAGIFVAYKILKSMTSELKTARYNRLSGLSVSLHPSAQLNLI